MPETRLWERRGIPSRRGVGSRRRMAPVDRANHEAEPAELDKLYTAAARMGVTS
jgi:hypothetical protein